MVGLLRLSPLIPFNLSNYLYGLTAIAFIPYVLATLIGMLPGAVLYVYLGTIGKIGLEASQGTSGKSTLEYVFLGVGLVATLIAHLVTRAARRALKQKTRIVFLQAELVVGQWFIQSRDVCLGWRMKRSFFGSLLALATIGMLFTSVARAGDDAMEALKKAQKAQLDAPASRMKVVTTDDNHKTSTVTIEMVQARHASLDDRKRWPGGDGNVGRRHENLYATGTGRRNP